MPSRRLLSVLLVFGLTLVLTGCTAVSPSSGGGQTKTSGERFIDPSDIALPPGFAIEAVATGLTFPTDVVVDEDEAAYVLESGYSYGEVWTTPRLLRIDPSGGTTVVASGTREDGPWTGVDYRDRTFYVTAGGELADGGRVLRVERNGKTDVLADRLPSVGDHHVNAPRVSPDGRWLYFGVGTATNSGVVGEDSAEFGWLLRHPDFHDIPYRDIRLTGQNFTTPNPLTEDRNDRATTGAYSAFGTPTQAGQVVRGTVPCTGAVLRIPLPAPSAGEARPAAADGRPARDMEVVAWGLRNPYGLSFAPGGELYVTENSFDDRGSRPVWGTGDVLWRIDLRQPGLWYGWPDFHAGEALTWSEHYAPPGKPAPQFLLAEHPNPPPRPVAKLGVHSSSNGIDFARNGAFGYAGQAFIAQFGDMAPKVGKVLSPVGYKVVRVDPRTGVTEDFAANIGKTNGPASRLQTGGFERPTALRFIPDGSALYVADFGVMTVGEKGPEPRQGTGVLWRITRGGGQ